MLEFVEIEEFEQWAASLDPPIAAYIANRIKYVARAGNANLDNTTTRLKGESGVYEITIDTGPGYRVYFCQRNKDVYLLLIGGIKKNQITDIKKAKALMKRELGGKK